MGSVRLGQSQQLHSRPDSSSNNSNSKPRNVLGRNDNSTDGTKNRTRTINSNNNTTGSENIVWSAAKKRGQTVIRTGRDAADAKGDITTISATRNSTTATRPATAHTVSTRVSSTVLPPSLSLTQPENILSPSSSRRVITTSRPSTSDSSSRPHSQHPLLTPSHATGSSVKLQDQDVALMLAPVLKENTGRMGHDNPSATVTATATASSRQRMASHGATTARSMNRPPLTPKIASAASRSSQQPQAPSLAAVAVTGSSSSSRSTTATTPTTTTRRSHARPGSVLSATTNSSRYDDDHSVLSAASCNPHLSSNVTPRSSSRQSRVDSANCTPIGTPNRERFDIHPSSPLTQGDSSRRPIVTFTAVSPKLAPARQDGSHPRDSKFFHASEIKAKSSAKNLRNSAFSHANGNDNTSHSTHNPAPLLPPMSPSLSHNQESKFMYANGTPEVNHLPSTRMSRSGSTVGSVRGSTVSSAVGSIRGALPNKQTRHPTTHRNSTGSQTGSINHNTTSSTGPHIRAPPPQLGPSAPVARRPGTSTPRTGTHSRGGSLVKDEREHAHEVLRPMASPKTGFFSPANTSPTQPPPLTLASIIQAADELEEHDFDGSGDDHSVLHSPNKSNASPTDPVTDLITNARRERRVQDLEIRNGSLEAINRTLERQLKKQSAELRRFRRLSRAGTLNLASTTAPPHKPPSTISEADGESGMELSGEDRSMTEDLEEEPSSDTDSDLSPSVQEARDAKHGPQDEHRLTVDLSKHQQILLDSQKINQSIKRCLDWTEQLIKDGRKALDYKVQFSDVHVGGRVLDPLDEEEFGGASLDDDDEDDDDDELDVDSFEPPTEILRWHVEPQDRDSGIEMPKDGL